jgi:hypothetical protein
MTPLLIPCPTCKGKGQRELCQEYQQTLDTLSKLGRATYGQIRQRMKKDGLLNGTFDVTIVHKRVARLCALGLVKKLKQQVPEKGDDQRRKAWVFERA